MNIIEEIVAKRKADIEKLGWDYGRSVPLQRARKAPVPFIAQKGVVLEVKRASPSKGDIAPALDAAATALAYAEAGASAISVLTEENYFKGNLDDLQAVCRAVDKWSTENPGRPIAVLRKDFIYAPEEIDVAYRAGADAVLLIARMLDEELLLCMLERCGKLGMSAFVELRLEDDLKKLASAKSKLTSGCRIVCGVNARDLKDFSIDLLRPASMIKEIKKIAGKDVSVIFESGIQTPEAASFAGSLGFTGMLLGEAAARMPQKAGLLVSSFVNAEENEAAGRWLALAQLLRQRQLQQEKDDAGCHHVSKGSPNDPNESHIPPLLKICGLTNEEDALEASLAGADFLGFIFCKKSPRNVDPDVPRKVRSRLKQLEELDSAPLHADIDGSNRPQFLVGVVVDCNDEKAKEAVKLVQEGVLDFLQLHGEKAVDSFYKDKSISSLPHFAVVNLTDEKDLRKLEALSLRGEPRILLDSKVSDKVGGTGILIDGSLVKKASSKLWLAGGINPDNAAKIVMECRPELIDVSSGIEEKAGKKDADKLLALCRAIGI